MSTRAIAAWLVAPLLIAWAGMAQAAQGTLRGVVIDAETGQPTACTVAIYDANERLFKSNPSFSAGIRCNGRFEQPLPAGKTRVRVTRGFETKAAERTIDVPPDGVADVRIELRRAVDLRKLGWVAGDSHAHMNHGEKTVPVDFDFVALTADAEDLQYLSLAQAWSMDDPTPEKLERELKSRSTDHCVLTWNLEAPKNYYKGDAGRCLGHCWMLGVRGRTAEGADVIHTLLEASAHDYESEKPTYANFESHRLIHSQGGSVFYTHPARWWTGEWGGRAGFPKQEKMRISNMAVELPLDTVLGPTFNGVDVITGPGEFQANAKAFALWALLLNHGYRVAATASSDACFDRVGGAIPGSARTYTYIEGPFSLEKVARATAEGRTFATTGPLLLAEVDGKPPGSVFVADGTKRELKIQAWASGAETNGLSRLEILKSGRAFLNVELPSGTETVSTNIPLRDVESAWYCVRVFGADARRQRAISGAFFLDKEPHQPPAPLESRAAITLMDAETGAPLSGAVTEVEYHGTIPRSGKVHPAREGRASVAVPGTMRLRAESPGYEAQTQSLFLDNPALVEFITRLGDDDLLEWRTYERARDLAQQTSLTFRLKRTSRGH